MRWVFWSRLRPLFLELDVSTYSLMSSSGASRVYIAATYDDAVILFLSPSDVHRLCWCPPARVLNCLWTYCYEFRVSHLNSCVVRHVIDTSKILQYGFCLVNEYTVLLSPKLLYLFRSGKCLRITVIILILLNIAL